MVKRNEEDVSKLSSNFNNPNEHNRVALYIRVSSKDQTENYSMSVQAKRLKEHCKEKNYLYRIYRENGESGFDTNRPQFQKLLQDAFMGKFDLVIVDKIDRLCRNLCDLTQIHKIFDELGIGIKSLSEPIDTTNHMGKYFLYQLGMFAEMERDWFRERSKKGREARFKEGKWKGGTTPFGYSYNQKIGKLEINETEANAVKLIFKKYSELKNIKLVSNFLNDNNIQTRTGALWHDSTVGNLLSRKIYIGVSEMNDDTYFDEKLRLIDDKLFDEVQKIREQRKNKSPKIQKGVTDPSYFFVQSEFFD